MNSAEDSNSFSPCALPNRLVDRIQISSGMQRIRTNVMELGKFTGGHRALSAGSHKTSVSSIILHGASGKQWTEGQTSALRRLALATRESTSPHRRSACPRPLKRRSPFDLSS